MTELSGTDVPVPVLIKDLERLLDLLFAVRVAHLAGHHGEEFREIDGAVAVSVDFVDHVLQLSLGGVLTERSHDSSELLSGDCAIAVWGGCEQRVEVGKMSNLPLSKRENASLNSGRNTSPPALGIASDPELLTRDLLCSFTMCTWADNRIERRDVRVWIAIPANLEFTFGLLQGR